MKYVEELGCELSGRELAIYDGSAGLSERERSEYVRHWKAKGGKKSEPVVIQLPAPDLSCPHRSAEPTGERVGCAWCDRRTLDVYSCDLHGKCVIEERPKGTEVKVVCKWCSDRPRLQQLSAPKPSEPACSITVNMGAGGLGDALLGAGAVLRLSQDRPEESIAYRVHPDAIPFVQLFDAGCRRVGAHAHDNNRSQPPDRTDRQANLGYDLEVRGQAPIPRWERYARNIGASGWSLPTLRDPDRLQALGRDYAGVVVLSPFSTWSNREYHLHGWRTIERMLAEHGYRVVVLDRRDSRFPDRHKAMQSECVIDAPAERVVGILLNAAAVVGNDSGIAHLGGILGRPTIVLCGQTTGRDIYGCYPQVRSVQGKLDCDGCWWQEPYHGKRCDAVCANLQTILPAEVLTAVDEVALPAIAGNRACMAAAKLGVIRDAVHETNHLAGDAAELGVWKGGSAKLIDHYLTGDCRLHLFDTFTGIPADDPGGKHRTGDFGDTSEADVRAFLAGTRAVFHVGEFPGTAPAEDLRFRFVHLDADTYASTLAGCKYLGDRMVAGGVIVFDDYGWRDTPGVQRALHEVFGDRWERVSEYQARVRF